jgi:hypothetical protein
MWLRTSAGTYVQITAVEVRTVVERVYNLTVEELHTYHVVAGGQAILVHNAGGDPRFDYLDRPGFKNYVLVDANGNVYYSGMYGPRETPASVQYRHSKNHNRFQPQNGDTMRQIPGMRTYGEARLMEQRLMEEYNTFIGSDGNNYRGNRQNPLDPHKKRAEYEDYEAKKRGEC